MSELTYIVGGQEKTASELIKETPKPPPKTSSAEHKTTHDRSEAKLSMGFIVTGRPAGYVDAARSSYDAAIKAHEEKPKENKHPGMFDDFLRRWKAKSKPVRISKRPYSLREAATVCADLATRAGWVDVEVEELMKT